MIGIGTTDIYIDTSSLNREELEVYSRELFRQWDVYVDNNLGLSDYSLSLSVEDGSVKALGRIGVALTALYIGIGQYGSFISGLNAIKGQVNEVSNYLSSKAVDPFKDKGVKPKIRKRGEALSRLEGLFRKVESGVLTVEDAIEQSKEFLGDADDVPNFYSELETSLNELPEHPSKDQLKFNFPESEEVIVDVSNQLKKNPPSRSPKSPKDHYRVVVWRDSREDFVNVTITKK